ncbi:LysR family transcriptional regulator [Oceanospirillum sanctuarii]|uniref:LysR family transcriptional regulator n=1 Tax=Oceanospirillum sanctuarii TaxID=1434821 RepID=UPI000A3D610F|nr:LysR family transcriptional regulator [Oceanospirillum sanctuarii]
MKLDPSSYPSLIWFSHVAHHGSFTKAADHLGITRAALSQHVKSLEQLLGVRLLNRTTRSMSLTEEGRKLLEVLTPALDSIERVVTDLQEAHDEPSGMIRINTSRVAANLLLVPVIDQFLQRHPKVKVEIAINDGFTNIISDAMDVGIRLGESLDEGMVAIPVSPVITPAIVASPDYLKRHGYPTTPNELTGHNCLAYRFSTSGAIDRWQFHSPEDDKRVVHFEPDGNAIFNDDDNMIQAALNGVGLMKHLDLCIADQLKAGTLVRVLDPWCKPFPGFYLYVSSRENMPAKIRALINFLTEQRQQLSQLTRTL